ncbi:MAG: toxin-activating lysine-acyltransferase [Pseudomonadota bacterium]
MNDQTSADGSGGAANGTPATGPGPDRPVASAFGDIVNVLMRTETFRELSLADLDWLVLPALQTGQFALAHGDPRPADTRNSEAADAKKPNIPIAVVLWAFVSDEVDGRLRKSAAEPILKLEATEWRSGDIPWIVAAGGVPDALRATLGHMAKNVFPAKPANIVIKDEGETKVVKLVPPKAQDN